MMPSRSCAGLVITVIGVVDDKIELPALTKLGGQALVAGIVVTHGVRILWIPLPGRIIALDDASSILITALFILLCTNAVNFVDGLDGLAGGVVLIGSLAFFVFSYKLADANGYTLAITAALLCAAMGGACWTVLDNDQAFLTADLRVEFLRSAGLQTLVASGWVVLVGINWMRESRVEERGRREA